MKLRASLILACVFAMACVPALREPPDVEELARLSGRAGDESPERGDAYVAEAKALYEIRTLDRARRASEIFLRAAAADPSRIDGLVGAIRAKVWLAGKEPDEPSRRAAALAAVQAAQHCVARAPTRVDCEYWLAVAIGVQARERRATALDALPRMVELLESAIARQPDLERAGPHRVLGLVLVRAPGWPTGPGDPDLGLAHARAAVALEPEFPPNQLCLAEALDATENREASRKAYETAASLARQAVAVGEPEAEDWLEEAVRGKDR